MIPINPNQIKPSSDPKKNTLKTVNGKTVWEASVDPNSTKFALLTTVVNGQPQLVWDDNNELIYTEVHF